ncbi:MAG: YsnF/AvaK domain-containing protein [Gammaproteobacteria bacterium]
METSSGAHRTDGVITVPVVQEEARIDVETVEAGGVRIHKTVHEHPHAINEAMQRDHVDVKHVPVNRIVSLSEAPQARQEGDTLIVPILEEVLVVEKRCRIKEEIHITRSQRTEQLVDTVVLRSEDVSIERFGPGS